MTIDAFLLLALVLIYSTISYGHSPGERSTEQQDDMHRSKPSCPKI
jgi:hypothetical protein